MSASLGQESVRAMPRTISVPVVQMAMVDLPWWGDLEDSANDYDLRAIEHFQLNRNQIITLSD